MPGSTSGGCWGGRGLQTQLGHCLLYTYVLKGQWANCHRGWHPLLLCCLGSGEGRSHSPAGPCRLETWVTQEKEP